MTEDQQVAERAADDSGVLVEDNDGIRVLQLNRPSKRNAVNDALREQMITALHEADRDRSVRGVVVTGAGRGFCAGGDINGMYERMGTPPGDQAELGWRRQRRTHELVLTLHALSKPTVAAVNGVASGLGADLATCCDFVVAAEDAQIIYSYVLRGLIPDGGAAYFLPRRVGLSRAKELVFSGRPVHAEEALRIGLVDLVVPARSLVEEAQGFLSSMAGNSPLAIALSKDLLNRSAENDVHELFASARQAQAACYTSTEHAAAVRRFMDRNASRTATSAS